MSWHEARLRSICRKPKCVLLACRRRHSKRQLPLTAPLMLLRCLTPTRGPWRRQWPTWHASHRTPPQVLLHMTASVQ